MQLSVLLHKPELPVNDMEDVEITSVTTDDGGVKGARRSLLFTACITTARRISKRTFGERSRQAYLWAKAILFGTARWAIVYVDNAYSMWVASLCRWEIIRCGEKDAKSETFRSDVRGISNEMWYNIINKTYRMNVAGAYTLDEWEVVRLVFENDTKEST